MWINGIYSFLSRCAPELAMAYFIIWIGFVSILISLSKHGECDGRDTTALAFPMRPSRRRWRQVFMVGNAWMNIHKTISAISIWDTRPHRQYNVTDAHGNMSTNQCHTDGYRHHVETKYSSLKNTHAHTRYSHQIMRKLYAFASHDNRMYFSISSNLFQWTDYFSRMTKSMMKDFLCVFATLKFCFILLPFIYSVFDPFVRSAMDFMWNIKNSLIEWNLLCIWTQCSGSDQDLKFALNVEICSEENGRNKSGNTCPCAAKFVERKSCVCRYTQAPTSRGTYVNHRS